MNIKGKVMQGDCLELMKNIPPGSIDMILCDLPYGTTACKWDTIVPFEPLWEHYKRIIKDNGAIVLTASQPFTSALVMSNPEMFRYEWIWVKSQATGHLNSKKAPMKAHESVLVFSKKTHMYNPIKTTGHVRKISSAIHKIDSKPAETYGKYGLTDYDSIERFPRTDIYFKSDKQKSSLHPTQKPVALFEYLIKTYTNEGDTVLDNCAGSGTTGEACVNLNRNCILMEKEPKYIEIINNRLKQINKMQENKLNDYEKDEKGYFKIIDGNKIYQIEEKTLSDKKTNDAINSFRQRPKGMTMSEWLRSQY